jgi:hypothetical protein
MSLESFLSKKLQRFSLLDMALVKLVYLIVSFLLFSLYSPLESLDWWAYLVLAVMAALPLYIHEFSVKGSLSEKLQNYLKTNNPSNQVLLFITMFGFGCMLCTLLPVLASYVWWHYVIVIIILAIKPATKNLYW